MRELRAAVGVAGGDVAVSLPDYIQVLGSRQPCGLGRLDDWLAQNGFVIPSDVTPVLDAYVGEGFDFLAMKLLPNQGVQAMRPVRVSSPGGSFSMPLRMAAIGTGVTVGITIWVVSEGRYEPQNFPFFHIDDSTLVWDWQTSSSNYTTLRAQNEASSANRSWEVEGSISLSQQLVTNVILAGGRSVANGGGFGGPQTPVDPSEDYLPVGPDVGASPADGGTDANLDAAAAADAAGTSQTAEEVRTADINALFAGIAGANARVTRIRSDIAHAAMTVDLILRASADQSELSNVRVAAKGVNEQCALYDGCNVVGTGSPAQAHASERARRLRHFSPWDARSHGGVRCARGSGRAAPRPDASRPAALAPIGRGLRVSAGRRQTFVRLTIS